MTSGRSHLPTSIDAAGRPRMNLLQLPPYMPVLHLPPCRTITAPYSTWSAPVSYLGGEGVSVVPCRRRHQCRTLSAKVPVSYLVGEDHDAVVGFASHGAAHALGGVPHGVERQEVVLPDLSAARRDRVTAGGPPRVRTGRDVTCASDKKLRWIVRWASRE